MYVAAILRSSASSHRPTDRPREGSQFECRFEGESTVEFDRCRQDEAAALEQLRASWMQFVFGDKSICLAATKRNSSCRRSEGTSAVTSVIGRCCRKSLFAPSGPNFKSRSRANEKITWGDSSLGGEFTGDFRSRAEGHIEWRSPRVLSFSAKLAAPYFAAFSTASARSRRRQFRNA
jgi:hypothetical protein